MIGQSLPEYVFIRTCIFVLCLVAPLSIAYIIASWCQGHWIYNKFLGYYAIVETSFYLFVYLPRSWRLQKEASHPELLPREEREALFARCFTSTQNADFATGWFLCSSPHKIRRGNVIEWILWALFSSSPNTQLLEWEEEIEGYIRTIEKLLGRKLEDGYNEEIRCMKVSMDPVLGVHRPLLWYMIVGIVDSYTAIYLLLHGFKHFSPSRWYLYFPPRPISSLVPPSPHPHISYWYRPHRSKSKHPVIFFHGIGVGLWPYASFFQDIIETDPDVGIIAIEDFSISMRISPPPLRRQELLEALPTVLAHHGFDKFVVIGHSYGTVVQAHIMRDRKLAPRVAGWLFIDPIPFLLHQPAVAYNFVYREPKTANEWQLWYFASRDPDIARALARYFFWAENILFKDDLEGKPVGVVLSGVDQIVDAEEVRRYLTDEEVAESRWQSKDGLLEVLWYGALDHSQVFDTRERRSAMVAIVSNLVRMGDARQQAVVFNGDFHHS